MRFIAVRIAWLGVATAAAASACAPVERNTIEVARVRVDTVGIEPVAVPELIRADPEEVAERALVGGSLGAMLGAGFAATVSANPAFGAIIGGPAGAVIGTVVGVATTRPLPSYTPVAVPATPAIPGFYDTWPPGYHWPPTGVQVPPPPPEWSLPLAATITPGEDPPPVDDLAPVEILPPARL
jgi:hypothetical protein